MHSRTSGRSSNIVSVINAAADRARKEFEAAARTPVSSRQSRYGQRNAASAPARDGVLTRSAFVAKGKTKSAAEKTPKEDSALALQRMKTEIQLLQTKLREQTQLRERDRRRQQEIMEALENTNRRLQAQNERLVDREYDLNSHIADLALEKDELRKDNGKLKRLQSKKERESAKSAHSPHALAFTFLSMNTLMDTTDPDADEPINNPAFMCPITREGIKHAVVLDCNHIFDAQSLLSNWNHANKQNYGKCPSCRRINRKIVFEGNIARGAAV